MKRFYILIIFALLFTFGTVEAQEVSRVFITSTAYNGNLGGISGADAKCQQLADTEILGGRWKAWISDQFSSPKDTFSNSNNAYQLLNGTIIADNWNELISGNLKSPINVDETGAVVPQSYVWTNTHANGEIVYGPIWSNSVICSNWTSTSWRAVVGDSSYANSYWSKRWEYWYCTNFSRLYCFEQLPTIPDPPKNLRAQIFESGADLTWEPPNDGGLSITEYKIYRDLISGGETLLATITADAQDVSVTYTDTGAIRDETYYYKVRALNAIGESNLSNEIKVIMLAAPSLNASAGNGQIVLNWNSVGSEVTNYKIYRSEISGRETLLTTIGNATTYTDNIGTAFSNRKNFYYKISAVAEGVEGALSNEASAMPNTVPDMPKNVSAVAGPNQGQITVTWQAPANNGGSSVTNYKLYINGGWAGNYGVVFSYSRYFYSDQLNPPSPWNYKIVAENSLGDSGFSEEVAIAPNHLSGTWTDTVGEGNFGESCNEWLARTGQAGKRPWVYHVTLGSPWSEFSCVYLESSYGVNSITYYWSGYKSGSWKPISSGVAYNGAHYKTQTLRDPGPSISIAKSGNGRGTVTGTGVNCGTDCNDFVTSYVRGDRYTLYANPAPGSWFGNSWSGACSGTEPCTLTMDESKSVEAHFDPVTLVVERIGSGAGAVAGPGINCGSDCFESELTGTITLVASPSSGSVFGGWLGDCSSYGTNPSCDLDMNSPKYVTAIFDLESSTLQVTKTGDGSGAVTSSPAGINCGLDCTEEYATGTIVALTATADPGSEFTGWSGSCSGNDECLLNMDAFKTATATFNKKTFSPTPGSGGVEGGPTEVRP